MEEIALFDLESEKTKLILEKVGLAAELGWYRKDDEYRAPLAKRYTEIEVRLHELKIEIKNRIDQRDFFRDIVAESLGKSFVRLVSKENQSRQRGNPPQKIEYIPETKNNIIN